MLRHLVAVGSIVATTLMLASHGVAGADPKPGDDGVTCNDKGVCRLSASTPGKPGTASKPAKKESGSGSVVADPCTYRLLKPQPPAGDPAWRGHQPGDGAIYLKVCRGAAPLGPHGAGVTAQSELVWLAAPPKAGGISPEQLARRAVKQMGLAAPQVAMAPKPGSQGLVGLPVWLWTTPSATTWGPVTKSAAVPGMTVSATARVTRISWAMGDGTAITCTRPGTPYRPEYGNRTSPDCGHVYMRASTTQPGGTYKITAASVWTVDWAGGGQTGQLTVTRTAAATPVRIGELQVVN